MSKEIVSDQEVKDSLDMGELITELERTFKSYYNGQSEMPSKSYVNIPEHNGDFRSMPARVKTDNIDLAGLKWVNVHPENKDLPTVMASVVINDPETGKPLNFLEGSELTRYRTGAVSGLATKFMTPSDVESLGIIGCGQQSYTQVKAISEVRDIEDIFISDISDKNIKNFIDKFGSSFDVHKSDNQKVMKNSEVVCTLTPTREPIVTIDNEKYDYHHINSIGADAEGKQEIKSNITSKRKIVVDDIDQASHSGEVNVPISNNLISQEDLLSLGKLISQEIDYREDKSLFDSTGLAIQDITAAALVQENL